MPLVVDECARQTDGAVARLAVVLYGLAAMHAAVVVPCHPGRSPIAGQRQQRVRLCDLGIPVRLRAISAELDLTLDAHGRRQYVPVFEPTYPALPADAPLGGRGLRDDVVQTRHEEAVRESVHPVLRDIDVAAADRARELVAVDSVVFDVVVKAVGAERVETRQGLGLLQAVQTDLALQELVSDVLAHLGGGGHLVLSVCSNRWGVSDWSMR